MSERRRAGRGAQGGVGRRPSRRYLLEALLGGGDRSALRFRQRRRVHGRRRRRRRGECRR
eukprot:5064936-Prymnesium_polylepis.1